MARPSKNSEIDYTVAHDLTAGLLERAACPDGVPLVLLKDTDKKGLRLRITKAGGKHWQFETRVKGKLFTRALGEWPAVSIGEARTQAHTLRGMTEQGTDPRELERQQQADKATQAAAILESSRQAALTLGEAWRAYVIARKPYWGEWQYQDQLTLGDAGGVKPKRGKPNTLTIARPIHPLMGMPLAEVTTDVIEDWAATEAKTRKSVSRRAHSCLKTFFSWCLEQKEYRNVITANPAKTKKSKEVLGRPTVRMDVLQREQLPIWFAHVRQIQNPVIRAYLQCLLLTGSRRDEMAALRWEDVNFQWNGLDLKDKIEGRRAVPLTPYVRSLIEGLPRRNEWVFSSVLILEQDDKTALRRARYHEKKGQAAPVGAVAMRSASGRLMDPSNAHRKACAAAGLTLTLHGLRRSFASLCEWLDIPGGISAQIQGHAPQGVREQNYIRRPLDLLRVHHEKIEAWILEQAGIVFDPKAEPGKLQLVGS
jgi:integrase